MKKTLILLFSLIATFGLIFGGTSLNAQSNDQLVKKLVDLFRGVDNESISDAVARAKSQLSVENRQVRQYRFERLFDFQISTLRNRGVSEKILDDFRDQKGVVVDRASNMAISDGNIPFIPVIKENYLGYYGLMSLVRDRLKDGYVALSELGLITDKFETPNDLYYIYDVEDGEAMRGKSPEIAENLFKQQGRSPLTATETIALAIHTDVLSRHYVNVLGSRYDESELIFLFLDEKPKLFAYLTSYSDSNLQWGIASCGNRYRY